MNAHSKISGYECYLLAKYYIYNIFIPSSTQSVVYATHLSGMCDTLSARKRYPFNLERAA